MQTTSEWALIMKMGKNESVEGREGVGSPKSLKRRDKSELHRGNRK